jgi:hypothetical protein
MKISILKLTYLTVTLAFTSICQAQGVPEEPKPSIAKGSVIIYNVKENNNTYQYTATVTKFSEADGVEFKWTTNEKKARTGTTSMPFINLSECKNLLVKPVAGNEKLGEQQVRLFFSDDLLVTLVGNKTVDFSIDGKENTFMYLATKAETGEFEYNGKKITVDYTGADAGDTYVGFVPVGDSNIMHSFRSKEMQFTLQSISTK